MALDHYTVFCGVFLYDGKTHDFNQHWLPWKSRLANADNFKAHVQRNYYETYLQAISPEQLPGPSTPIHFTNASVLASPVQFTHEKLRTPVRMMFFDIYGFQQGVGVYAFKVQFEPGSAPTYNDVSQLTALMRTADTQVSVNGKSQSMAALISELLKGVSLKANWNRYTPNSKTYTIINETSATSWDEGYDERLFEVANTMDQDSYGKSPMGPSEHFYNEVYEQNSIQVFSNWKAITLFDSFTRLSLNAPDNFNTWETEFLNIYILSLYTKFQLYYFNTELKDVAKVSRHAHQIKDNFIEFVNDYNLAYISYKFLPNLLYERIREALEVRQEIEQVEVKATRLSEAYVNYKSNQLNGLLTLLSLLSLVSVYSEISGWLSSYGVSDSIVYSIPSLAVFAGSITLAALLYRFRRR